MLSPQDLIGQKVWLSPPSASEYGPEYAESQQVQAEITQPTTPPWFFARYLNPPPSLQTSGQWLTLHEAQLAVLTNPVIDYDEYDDYEEDLDDCWEEPDTCRNQLKYR